jgi:hypothetical protein
MKMYGGVGIYIHVFLTLALDGVEWSASRSGRFTPGERARNTHWIGSWVGLRAGVDEMEKRKYHNSLKAYQSQKFLEQILEKTETGFIATKLFFCQFFLVLVTTKRSRANSLEMLTLCVHFLLFSPHYARGLRLLRTDFFLYTSFLFG